MHISLPDLFSQHLQRQQLFPRNARLIVAVSGGLDSIVLCHLLHKLNYTFVIAHCHFGLRGLESDRDAAFVQAVAQQLQVPFYARKFDTRHVAAAERLSIQEAARKLRYEWFAELRRQLLAEANPESGLFPVFVLTAHHQDDDVETLLMHFFKGTGMQGLRGIQPSQEHLVRPLLSLRREQLEAYAHEAGLKWVEDSSNSETKYTRNFFRHEVLPLISQRIPRVKENLAANLVRFGEAFELYQQAVDQHLQNICEKRGAELHIPVLKLARSKPVATLTYELLKPYGFNPQQIPQVLLLLDSETGRYVQSNTHQVVRHRKWLIVAPLQPQPNGIVLVGKEQKQVSFSESLIELQEIEVPENLLSEPNIAFFDAATISFPLLLRPWKAGDYFYPLGLGKKKKVSRLLIDLKLSRPEKERIHVLESGNRIIWVVGLRMDERFKVGPATKRVLCCTLKPRS